MAIVLTFNNVFGIDFTPPLEDLWSSEGVKMGDDAYMTTLMSGLNTWPDPEVSTATAFETGAGASLLKFAGAFAYASGSEIPLSTSTITSVIQYPGFGDYKYSITGLPNLPFDYDTFDIWTAFKSVRDQGVRIDGYATKDTLIGGAGPDTINGGDAFDTIYGGGGNDLIHGGSAGESFQNLYSDRLYGEDGNDTLIGGDDDSVDLLFGGPGNDFLNAGAGSSAGEGMTGGPGDDTYIAHTTGGNFIDEQPNEGYDTVIWKGYWGQVDGSSVPGVWSYYQIPANTEKFVVDSDAGEQVLAAGGAGSIKELIGGRGNDNLQGGFSGTTIRGGNGNDDLFAGNGLGADYLDGEAGADRMAGKDGGDTYVIDNAGDLICDIGGIDTVLSSISFTLPNSPGQVGQFANSWPINLVTNAGAFEHLTLIGASAINGTGNALANKITGNAAANSLSGLDGDDIVNGSGGVDTMRGGLGDDIFVVGSLGETVIEGAGTGTDTVNAAVSFVLPAHVENLVLVGAASSAGNGNTLNNKLTGNAAANVLKGLDGNDSISGGAGADILYGGAGADLMKGDTGFDTFVFADALIAANRDSVLDYNPAADTIRLDNAVFTALTAVGTLAASALSAGPGGGVVTAATRLIFNSSNGKLFYDADGSSAGAAPIHFATLTAGLVLTNADFVVI